MSRAFVFLYRMLHPAVSWLRSRPLAFRLIFGLKVPQDIRVHYDTTTVLLKKALAREIHNGDRVLEMGIGQAALLSLFIAKRKRLVPSGVDLSESRVRSSVHTAALNNIKADFWTSDLFSKVQGVFDVIFFNPPYVDTATGHRLGLSKRLRLEDDAAWNGGLHGTGIIAKFVTDSTGHLSGEGKLIIGVQDFYVKEEAVREIAVGADYYIHNIVSARLNPSRIYILKRKDKPLS